MTCTMHTDRTMAQMTFGSCANAASFCANIAAVDAILVASIIICALVSITILVSVFVAGISILVLVLLVLEYCDSPRLR